MHAEPRTVGYQFATAKVLAGATDEFRKEELRSLTDPEIREVLESEFSSLPPRLGRMILFDLTFAPKHPGGFCQQEVSGVWPGGFSIYNVFEIPHLEKFIARCFQKSTFPDGGSPPHGGHVSPQPEERPHRSAQAEVLQGSGRPQCNHYERSAETSHDHNSQTGAAVTVGAVGIVGLSVAAALASEFVLFGLPLVMGPGAVMTTHRLVQELLHQWPK